MMLSFKELIVVLAIAAVVFTLAKPVALLFTSNEDFARRRNAWYLLTTVAFLSPSFWIFVAVAVPILVFAGGRDSSPAALYLLLLHVIPPISIRIPMIGISFLFHISNYMLLALCVMTPAAIRLFHSKGAARILGLGAMDFCLLTYGLLQSILYLHPQYPNGTIIPATYTDDMRRAFEFLFGIFVPYFVISRSTVNRRTILDLLATFCLSCVVLAPIAIFETARHWLLYGDMANRWGYAGTITPYLMRGQNLRAMASAGHSLALGYLLALGIGFWLYLKSYVKSTRWRLSVTVLLWLGLLATYSLGPWIVAIAMCLILFALRTSAFRGVFWAICLIAVIVCLVSLTPLGDKVINMLALVGGTASNPDLIYRQRLWDRVWQIIQGSPLFGDQYALLRMQDLRQGQGIIDVVNTYAGVLLSNGVVGLSLFLSFITLGLFKVWALSKSVVRSDRELGMLGVILVVSILGTLIMCADGSFNNGLERMFYALAGISGGYAYIAGTQSKKRFRYDSRITVTQRASDSAPGAWGSKRR